LGWGEEMRRREFITLLGGAAAWPLAARAQQPTPIVGLINGRSAQDAVRNVAAFRKGLDETGYVEGQNLMVEYHWLDGQYHRLAPLVDDLIRRRVDVIATPAFRSGAKAVKAATSTIPIVFGVGGTRSSWDWSPALPGRAAMRPASIPSIRGCGQAAWPPA